MIPTFWQRARSYMSEVEMETTESNYNDLLRVVLRRGRYQLQTRHAIYSYGDLYDNFRKTFEKIRITNLPVKNVLILGVGLGSIPFMLEKKFRKNYAYTGVEIDGTVLQLAQKYVLDDLKSPMMFHLTDAEIFVSMCREKFDLICMDVFIDDKVPSGCETLVFLQQLKKILTPQTGILLFNKLAATPSDRQRSGIFLDTKFKKIFTNADFIEIAGNYILINRGDLLNR